MSSEIKEAVTRCQVCAEYQANNPHQPRQTHKIPDTARGRLRQTCLPYYIGLVSYAETSPVRAITSTAIIKFGKVQFGQNGIADALVTDNGPHFVSREFTEFAKQWEFQLVILSPYRPKSKRKAQSGVKVVKNLFEKALKDNKDRG
ncbi:uncharacterized protein LOC122951200 [Acropora millepora]|uniref:uncharacterized protein LOC122951200 n=1 Tax=Acropora millepora TaxID=45264 RepID=UPI001CF1D3CD|nr:uncharacterized protein LOC122951200 [Acropora millepora]